VVGATRGCSVTCTQQYEAPGTAIPNPRPGGAARTPSFRDEPPLAAHLHQNQSVANVREAGHSCIYVYIT